MKVSMVVVCHHSSEVLCGCVESFRREARTAGVEPEVVLVEQSENAGEERAAAAVNAERLLVRPNRGYAAGLNAGISAAQGETLLLANPDLWFSEHSLTGLLAGLDAGFDVVGPQLTWDRAGTVLFPVAEDPAPRAELIRTLRRRWQRPWRAGLRPWLDDMWRVWSAAGPVEVPCLRGPLLALRRDTADRYGPLDEEYFLYYEETEWLWRARRSGARFGLVGNSKVGHHWGHSTARTTDRGEVEARSRERFFERNYPARWRWMLRRIAGPAPAAGVSGRKISGCQELPETAADLWLFSPFRHLQPSAGCVNRSRLSDHVAEVTKGGRWYVLAANRSSGGWRTVGSWTWGNP